MKRGALEEAVSRAIRAWELTREDDVPPAVLFAVAQTICAAAYEEQGGPSGDPDVRERQYDERDARKASAFERLYCRIRNISHDWHSEAVRRRDGLEAGELDVRDCNADACTERTFALVDRTIGDWDY